MPNKNTFHIPPIKELLGRYVVDKKDWIDGFARGSRWAETTNDINAEYSTTHNLEAMEFFSSFDRESIQGVLFDPPYSLTQAAYSYKQHGEGLSSVNPNKMEYWARLKDQVASIIKPNGLCISLGWNTMGLGKNRGFKKLEILLVPHGGTRNDTIVTVEQKVTQELLFNKD